jgi:hypothetical protein
MLSDRTVLSTAARRGCTKGAAAAAIRNAASLFTGAGPGATLAFSAPAPSRTKSLRHRRTVSSRTPNASAMRGLVQPASVSNTARARSASPRSREPASAVSVARWSSVAETGDRPASAAPANRCRQGINPLTVGQAARFCLAGRLLTEMEMGGDQWRIVRLPPRPKTMTPWAATPVTPCGPTGILSRPSSASAPPSANAISSPSTNSTPRRPKAPSSSPP